HGVRQVAFSRDGTLLAASNGSVILLWETATGKPTRLFGKHVFGFHGAALSPDGKTLATAVGLGGRKQVSVWDIATGKERLRFQDEALGSGDQLAFAADGKALAVGSTDRSVLLWDPAAGKLLRQLPGKRNGWGFAVAFTRDGKRLFALDTDGKITC